MRWDVNQLIEQLPTTAKNDKFNMVIITEKDDANVEDLSKEAGGEADLLKPNNSSLT